MINRQSGFLVYCCSLPQYHEIAGRWASECYYGLLYDVEHG